MPIKLSLLHLLLLLLLGAAAEAVSLPFINATIAACEVSLSPSVVEAQTVGTYQSLTVNCSCCDSVAEAGWLVVVRASISNAQIAAITAMNRRERQAIPVQAALRRRCDVGEACTFREFPYSAGEVKQLYIEANNVGRARILISLFAVNSSSWAKLKSVVRKAAAQPGADSEDSLPNKVPLGSGEISIVALRKQRMIDRAFEWSIGLVASVLAFCMGCMTDLRETRPHYKRPLALLTCLILQHLFLPPIALGLYKLFGITDDMGFGLVAIATMPGGGMAHLTVFLMSGDRNLSAAISLLNALINLGLSPAWLSLFTHYLQFELLHYRLVLWLLMLFISQFIGSLVATCRPGLAQAALNWVGRPLLLLATILMVTLGIYINHYAIDHLESKEMGCVLAFIASGFCLGGLASYLVKLDKPRRKTLAAETACCACLVAIPAIRMSCDSPTADLATIMPLAAAIFTPAPIIVYLVSHRVKGLLGSFIDKRKEKQSRHFSIVSSLAKMAEDVTAVSAPLVIEEGEDGSAEKQKVTTL
ncbi:hypothetical protein BOX15_Mlig006522g1 [Macrostomum lignano]|uniref:Uncharacterized protein n=2 Tax=Macrostomum lignano TaxID=282301 RepID=A0A267GIA8_9PLAT|nr:hypothetical protein BOX15_Mlig006522g1 [Macrostomum lignano]